MMPTRLKTTKQSRVFTGIRGLAACADARPTRMEEVVLRAAAAVRETRRPVATAWA